MKHARMALTLIIIAVAFAAAGPTFGFAGAPSLITDDATAHREQPFRRGPQDGFRTIVIDPGHGGSEIGAVGPTGLTEKFVAFDISQRLHDLIEERLGLDVRLTREADVDKDLEQRTAFANNLKADIFVSVHANAYRGRGVRGAETFFLSDRATDDDARRLAAVENDALDLQGPASGDSDLQMLLWDMAQTEHLFESSVLAEMIQVRLNSLAGTADRGVKQAPFRVLRGANMPSVLVEVGFLSNPDEERLLADPQHRQRIAEQLYQSLNQYRRRRAQLIGSSQR